MHLKERRENMNKLKNKNGSVLSTAIIVLLVVASLTAGMYMIANMYLRNTINNSYERQAYLYAKSECTSLANYLIKYQETGLNKYYVAQKGDKITFSSMKLQNKSGVESTKVKFSNVSIERTDDKEIKYSVTATVHNQSSTVKLTCKKNANNKWVIGLYS